MATWPIPMLVPVRLLRLCIPTQLRLHLSINGLRQCVRLETLMHASM